MIRRSAQMDLVGQGITILKMLSIVASLFGTLVLTQK